jgi:hypothetical protein
LFALEVPVVPTILYFSSHAPHPWDLCAQLTPFVEPVGPNEGFLDLTGCGPLERLWSRLEKELGPLRWGMAGNKMVARIAYQCGNKKVPEGSEGAFLAPLSLDYLPFPPGVIRELRNLGLFTIGQLAAVPLRDLERQLGPLGRELFQAARGIDQSKVQAAYPPPRIICRRSWDFLPAHRRELEGRLLALAQELGEKLVASKQRCGRLRARSDDQLLEIVLTPPVDEASSLQRAVFYRLLPRLRPGFSLELRALDLTPRQREQLDLFQARPELDPVIERLQTRWGPRGLRWAAELELPRRARCLRQFQCHLFAP